MKEGKIWKVKSKLDVTVSKIEVHGS